MSASRFDSRDAMSLVINRLYTRRHRLLYLLLPILQKCMFQCGHDIEGMVEGGLRRRGKWKSADAGTEAREDIMASVAVLESGADRLVFLLPLVALRLSCLGAGGMTGPKKSGSNVSKPGTFRDARCHAKERRRDQERTRSEKTGTTARLR